MTRPLGPTPTSPPLRAMTLSPQDASASLDEIDFADRRVRQYKGYREASPFLLLWGFIWLIANAVTGLAPAYAGRTWFAAVVIGSSLSLALVVMQSIRSSRSNRYSDAQRARRGRSVAMIAITFFSFFPAVLTVLSPLNAMQGNAFISLFWAFAYMMSGAWLGVRMFVAGLVTAIAILSGYLFLKDFYFLWMAFVGGGSLILAGLWLRKF
ncbi:MAG: hypothetical protein ABIP38_11450 [Steroidobacteraceae bacterium]